MEGSEYETDHSGNEMMLEYEAGPSRNTRSTTRKPQRDPEQDSDEDIVGKGKLPLSIYR